MEGSRTIYARLHYLWLPSLYTISQAYHLLYSDGYLPSRKLLLTDRPILGLPRMR